MQIFAVVAGYGQQNGVFVHPAMHLGMHPRMHPQGPGCIPGRIFKRELHPRMHPDRKNQNTNFRDANVTDGQVASRDASQADDIGLEGLRH